MHPKAGSLTMTVPDQRVPRLVWALQLALLRPNGRSGKSREHNPSGHESAITSIGSETHMRPPREKGGLSPAVLVCKMGTVSISLALSSG